MINRMMFVAACAAFFAFSLCAEPAPLSNILFILADDQRNDELGCAELIGDRCVEFVELQPKEQPFFLYMSFNIAHAEDRDHRPGIGQYPWPKMEDGLYEDITPLRPKIDDRGVFNALPEFLKDSLNRVRWYWRWDTPEKYTVNMRARYRMITGMDCIIGRVLDALEKQGLADNTVIIYSADNGYYRGGRGRYDFSGS